MHGEMNGMEVLDMKDIKNELKRKFKREMTG